MSFPRKEIPAVMPRSIIDSNDSLFNPKKGSFTNDVDRFLHFFDPPPFPLVDSFT